MLYKVTEWQSGSGMWHCNCVDDLVNDSGHWLHPVRILKLDPADYVKLMVEKFNARVSYNKDYSLFFFCWNKQTEMRKYKNYINAEARKVQYHI